MPFLPLFRIRIFGHCLARAVPPPVRFWEAHAALLFSILVLGCSGLRRPPSFSQRPRCTANAPPCCVDAGIDAVVKARVVQEHRGVNPWKSSCSRLFVADVIDCPARPEFTFLVCRSNSINISPVSSGDSSSGLRRHIRAWSIAWVASLPDVGRAHKGNVKADARCS
jgi:hypothetical protein